MPRSVRFLSSRMAHGRLGTGLQTLRRLTHRFRNRMPRWMARRSLHTRQWLRWMIHSGDSDLPYTLRFRRICTLRFRMRNYSSFTARGCLMRRGSILCILLRGQLTIFRAYFGLPLVGWPFRLRLGRLHCLYFLLLCLDIQLLTQYYR